MVPHITSLGEPLPGRVAAGWAVTAASGQREFFEYLAELLRRQSFGISRLRLFLCGHRLSLAGNVGSICVSPALYFPFVAGPLVHRYSVLLLQSPFPYCPSSSFRHSSRDCYPSSCSCLSYHGCALCARQSPPYFASGWNFVFHRDYLHASYCCPFAQIPAS